MLTEVLDSTPTADITFPDHLPVNVIPTYKSKVRGQSILGHKAGRYTHFTPVRGPSERMKTLLEISESDTSDPNPVEPDKELLKAEKIAKGEDVKPPPPVMVDPKFKAEAKEYMETPDPTQKESYGGEPADPVTATIKKDQDVANIIAAATFSPRTPRKQPKKTIAKKPTVKRKKMNTFRIAAKRKP